MTKRKLIVGCYALTALAVLVFLLYSAFQLDESSSIGLLFFPFFALGIFGACAWVETLVFMLLFFRSFRELRGLLLPVFLVSSIAPLYALYIWNDGRPFPVPAPGPLPAAESQYFADKAAIETDFLAQDISLWSKWNRVDTIYSVHVDTIIYALDKEHLFAFIIVSALSENKHRYFNEYRAGSRDGDHWSFSRPKGNIWSTQFESPDSIRIKLLQYYYDRYSINGSDPEKKEIWDDTYIFPE